MPAPKGHKRYGGRTKGTPNKSAIPVQDICNELGINPFRVMAEYCTVPSEDLAIEIQAIRHQQRFNAAKELAQYLAPKRKALELSLSDLTTDELVAEVEARLASKSQTDT